VRLIDLDPTFVRYEEREETWQRVVGDPLMWKAGDPTELKTGPRAYTVPVETLAEAQGIRFVCPKCAGGSGHRCDVSFAGRGVPDHLGSQTDKGAPSRWSVSGTGFEDLTLQPSIQLIGGCNWHGYLLNGDAT
jgi:hypothetical protein